MTQQTFSLEMCRLLSSLALGFEGHWWWVKSKGTGKIHVVCDQEYYEYHQEYEKICPAWQVEDVLRNLKVILGNREYPPFIIKNQLINFICDLDVATAYQKIEEYLWSILK